LLGAGFFLDAMIHLVDIHWTMTADKSRLKIYFYTEFSELNKDGRLSSSALFNPDSTLYPITGIAKILSSAKESGLRRFILPPEIVVMSSKNC